MNATPIYAAQGGGRLYWRVTSSSGDYSDQLASISGLCKRVNYNGGLFFGAVTIQIAGGGMLGSDTVGSVLTISLVNASGTVLTSWGDYAITAIDAVQKSAKITAEPIKKQQIPEDYNRYEHRPWQPRRVAQYWLEAAMAAQGGGSVTIPLHAQVTTNHPRSAGPLMTHNSTLSGLCGLIGPASSPGRAVTRMQLGTHEDASTWTGTTIQSSAPPMYDMEMEFAPQKGLLVGKTPLYWHYIGSGGNTGYLKIKGIFRDTNTGQTANSKCQLPLGVIQYVSLSARWYTTTNTTLYANKNQTVPAEVKEITLEFQSRAEAKQYLADASKYRPSATPMSPFGKSTRMGTTADGGRLRRNLRHGGKTVSILNYAQYNGIFAPWYYQARTAIGSGASLPSSVTCAPDMVFGEGVVYSNTVAIVYPTPGGIMAANVHIIPQRLDLGWIDLGISAYSDFKPGYMIEQELYPVTIAQDYTTRENFCEACMLGSIGFYQTGSGLVGADLCREKGAIYAMPITTSTAVAINAAESYPMPREVWINFRDPYGVNRSYQYADPQAWLSDGEGEALSVEMCQGVVQPEGVTISGSSCYLTLSANNWAYQPGMRGDALHGADWSTSYQGLSALASNAEPEFAHLQGKERYYTLTAPNYNYSREANYGIRTPSGAVFKCFLSTSGRMNLNPSQAEDFSKETEPVVDAYPIAVWAEANHRVYSANHNRKSWTVQTTMAFASAEPGDVVAVQLPQLYDGQKLLATVLAVEVDSNGLCKIDIVPMHLITSDDYNNFTNLAAVMP